jgi:uncharacterized protein (TIGR02300 family)
MPAKDLGVKYACWKCGAKFYDLKKSDPVCPKCGSDPRQAPVVKQPPLAERRRAAKEAPVEEVAAEAVEGADLEEELDEEADEPEETADEDA